MDFFNNLTEVFRKTLEKAAVVFLLITLWTPLLAIALVRTTDLFFKQFIIIFLICNILKYFETLQ